MEYSKAIKHRYNVDNLHLDAGERAALKKALPGNGEGWFDIYEYANAWAESLLLDGAPALGINEFYEEPGGAWLITRANESTRHVQRFYDENATIYHTFSSVKLAIFYRDVMTNHAKAPFANSAVNRPTTTHPNASTA